MGRAALLNSYEGCTVLTLVFSPPDNPILVRIFVSTYCQDPINHDCQIHTVFASTNKCLRESGWLQAGRTLLAVFSVSADPGESDAKAGGWDLSAALAVAVATMVLRSRQHLQHFANSWPFLLLLNVCRCCPLCRTGWEEVLTHC